MRNGGIILTVLLCSASSHSENDAVIKDLHNQQGEFSKALEKITQVFHLKKVLVFLEPSR